MATSTGEKKSGWLRVAAGIGGLVALGVGVKQIVGAYEAVTLPTCDAARTTDTLTKIIGESNPGIEARSYSELKTTGSDDKMMNCTGVVTLQDGTRAPFNYRTFWEGWTQKVEFSGLASVTPTCAGVVTKSILTRLIRDNNPGLEASGFSDIKTIGSDEKMATCTGVVTLKDGRKVSLNFRATSEGQAEIIDSRFL